MQNSLSSTAQVIAAIVQMRPFIDFEALGRDAVVCTALLGHLHGLLAEFRRRRQQPRRRSSVGEVRILLKSPLPGLI